MNIILSVYSENGFREYQLPSVNNADYTIVLPKEAFDLKQNVKLNFEVLDNQWKVKEDIQYKVSRNKQKYYGEALEDADVLKIVTRREEVLSLIVRYVKSVFHYYEKYSLAQVDSLSIGQKSENDIVYDYLGLVSRKHAVIKRVGSGFKIVNESTNGIYVNAHRIEGEVNLHYGDYINIIGLHILFLGTILAIDTIGSGAVLNSKKLRKYILPQGQDILETERKLSVGKHIYHRAPRSMDGLEEDTIEIEEPPQLNQTKKQPLAMMIGPSLTMALPMMMGSMMMVNSGGSGASVSMYSGLVMAVSSALIGVGWTLVNLRHENKEEKAEEKYRFDKYGEYLIEKTQEIKMAYEETIRKLAELYPAAAECLEYDMSKGILWNRNFSHKDFFKHRLGIGNQPFQISIDVPKKRFSLYEDELTQKPTVIKENYGMLYDVPITFDMQKNKLIGVIGDKEKRGAVEIAKSIAAQIIANNCYTDIKLGFVYDKNAIFEAEQFQFAKWLPHVWSEDKKTRYLASTPEQASDVFFELAKICRNRVEESKESFGREEVPKPYYILFITDMSMLEGELLAKYILGKEKECGLTTFILTERYEELPNNCDFIIENTSAFQGMYEVTEKESEKQKIVFDKVEEQKLDSFARYLANLQVLEMEKGGEIPNALTFFDMLEILRPQDLPVKELWAKNRTYDNIKGMVGYKSGGVPCYLDVHEKYHGPHGLIAGTTGSGKSETLQTYMLSLAINYSPDDIGFFIIDYKGGGMANLFSGLPHMIGSISNLSGNQVKRAMISIKSENRRRQRVFTENGVNNINNYTKLYKNGEVTLPVPHLFIIIDEFAELKREEPEFMKELISVAQVGRSLGVHLILATQKPSGTVDDNIWSNTKFRLCLRVADKQDSNDMLHKPDAAYITQAGRCYMQVGNDEIYELFQSGYSGATYEEDVSAVSTDTVKLLTLSGKVDMTGNSVKISNKKRIESIWMEHLIEAFLGALQNRKIEKRDCMEDAKVAGAVAEAMYPILEKMDLDYPKSPYNTERLLDFMDLYIRMSENAAPSAEKILQQAMRDKVKLPQKKEKTQLDAIKEHLAIVAQENGYDYHMQLWMPVLPKQIYLEEFEAYRENCCKDGKWKKFSGEWSLDFVLGKMDDPGNQNQMPLVVNFAEQGHIAIIGNIVCGKSTMMQTMAYALMHKYSPQVLHMYALDFSSKMMAAFEAAPHMGGIMYEDDGEKIGKFFNMMDRILEERKTLLRGGNYRQYVQKNGVTIPAIVIFVDNYASFKEKTQEVYERNMVRLSKEGVSHGIFLVVSGSGVGINDITTRVYENITTTLCLSLQDRYDYVEYLHNNRIDVMPESDVKGRGLAVYGERILEYQTALAVEAENDYERMEWIAKECEKINKAWTGRIARQIPKIPKKPVWSVFSKLEDFDKQNTSQELLPVGYDMANAEVYSIHLRHTYCYTIYGMERSGKTNFLKVCIQAAMLKKDAKIFLIDGPAHQLQAYKEEEGVVYMDNDEEIFQFLSDIKPEFIRRNKLKQGWIKEDKEEDEIFDAMSKEMPYFIFISQLDAFVNLMNETENGQRSSPFVRNIMEKGQLHHIYFIADMDLEKRNSVAGYPLYELFVKYKNGIHFGGRVGQNPYLNFDYLSYVQKERAEAAGIGYLPDNLEDTDTKKVVVPLARR